MSESKHWPVVADGTKIGVLSISKNTVVNELGSNNGILAGLVRHGGGLTKKSARGKLDDKGAYIQSRVIGCSL